MLFACFLNLSKLSIYLFQWEEDVHSQNKKLVSFYKICDKNRKGANSWVTTPGIATNGSAHLWLEVKYSIKPCDDAVPVCQLGVYYYELDRPSLLPVPLHTPWKELLTLTNNVTTAGNTLLVIWDCAGIGVLSYSVAMVWFVLRHHQVRTKQVIGPDHGEIYVAYYVARLYC